MVLLSTLTLCQNVLAEKSLKQVAVIKVTAKKNLIRELVGIVYSPEHQNLSLEVSGLVRSDRLMLGTQLKKGELVIQLDQREAKAQESLALAETEHSEISVQRHQLAFNRAQQTFQNNLTSKAEFEEAKLGLQQAKSDLSIAKANQQLAALHTEKHVINAPFDGTLTSHTPSYGSHIMAGVNMVGIINTSYLEFRVYCSAKELELLSQAKALLMLADDTETPLNLMQHSPTSHLKNGMFEVIFSLPKDTLFGLLPKTKESLARHTPAQFYSGQALTLRLVNAGVSVPELAILEDMQGKYGLIVNSKNKIIRVALDDIQIGQSLIVMRGQNVTLGESVTTKVLSETK
jgi:RND family efflux transporter MFP subunit